MANAVLPSDLPSIENAVVGGGCPKGSVAWVIHETEDVDGVKYVKLNRRDSGFCRYVLGRNAGHNGLKDYKYLEKLRALRSVASERVINGDDTALDAIAPIEASPSPVKVGQRKLSDMWAKREDRAKAREVAADIKVVDVEVEKITYNGVTVGPLTIQMPSCLDFNKVLSVPLKPDVLQYIRVAILAEGIECKNTRRKMSSDMYAPKNAKWIEKRNAFVAKRRVNGVIKYKAFKVAKADNPIELDSAMGKARDACNAWLLTGDQGVNE